MICATYSRKSDDNSAGVARQTELCRDFIAARGWKAVADFQDNDISGGVFDRPGLNAMLQAIDRTPRPFDAVVMMDSSRLGRNMEETLPRQLRIVRSGVRVFHYQDGQELLLNTPVQKLVATVANFSNEDYKYQVSQKTKATKRKKAEKGHVGGGRCFGYDNIRDPGGDVGRVINTAQAAVVLRLFEQAAKGVGHRRMLRELRELGIPGPLRRRVRNGVLEAEPSKTWSSGCLTHLLRNRLYIGEATYGATEMVAAWDGKEMKEVRVRQRGIDPVVVKDESWRIVPDALFDKVQAVLESRRGPRGERGRFKGRDPKASWSNRYLLSGISACSECGGSVRIAIRSVGPRAARKKVPVYVCSSFERGSTCRSNTTLAARVLEGQVVGTLVKYLSPEVVQPAIDVAVARILARRGPAADLRARLEQELNETRAKGKNLVSAIAHGGEIASLVKALKDTEAAEREIAEQMKALHDEGPVDETVVRAKLHGYVEDIRDLLSRDPGSVLRSLVRGRIKMTPFGAGRDRGFKFSGELLVNRVLEGTATSGSPVRHSMWG